jgi:uncharacterized protein (TIGR00290 family)
VKSVLLAWSGGKDSAWTLQVLRRDPEVRIAGLFTTIDEDAGRVAVHNVRTPLLRAQAQSIGVPLHMIAIPRPCPNDAYERAIGQFIESEGRRAGTHLAFGDLFLEDIRRYRERQFAGAGMELLFPLWGRPTRALAEEMTDAGLRAWIACVDGRRAPRAWAGRVFDRRFVDEVPSGIDPCGENGEFHTFVFTGPMLRSPVLCRPQRVEERDGFVYADLVAGSDLSISGGS